MKDSGVFSSVWTQPSPYWLIFEHVPGFALADFSDIPGDSTLCAKQVGKDWHADWLEARTRLMGASQPPIPITRAAVIPAAHLPPLPEITRALRPATEIHAIVDSLWLARDIGEGRLDCYMQRVVDRRQKLIGYEAFARMESRDGGVIGGGAIMQAARVLHTEYHVDRLLHKQAVERFIAQDLDGYLFINFLTGFIQRPEVYLEGLSSAASRHQVRSGAIVLDVPLSDYARDMPKLISIADFCRARGFALALDDVSSTAGLAKLLQEIRPAFVKLDGKFTQETANSKRDAVMRDLVALAHEHGATVLAEGIENQAMHDSCFAAGVDMFQGYFIGRPERQAPSAKEAAN